VNEALSVQKESSYFPEDLAPDRNITLLENRADKSVSLVWSPSSLAFSGLRELNRSNRAGGILVLIGD